MKIQENSPSNIRTGWNQKFFYKVESDGMLNYFVKIFTQNGNSWSMPKDTFDKIIAKGKINDCFSFIFVREQVLETEGDFIKFKEYVAESLLTFSWTWSLRNALKNWKRATIVVLFLDAWASIFDPEARTLSEFKYLNGNPMSVRYAKKEGLIK